MNRKAIVRSGGPPIYLQLADILQAEIASLDKDEMTSALPSEFELAKQFKTSRVTVRQALKKLESRGLIYTERGKGSFPTIPRMKIISGFSSFTDEVETIGRAPGARVIEASVVSGLPIEMTRHLTDASEDRVEYFRLKRVRTIDGAPVAVEDVYLPTKSYPGINEIDFTNRSLFSTVREYWGVVPTWTDSLIEPAAADHEQAELLDIEVAAPLIIAWRATLSETDDDIEFAKSAYKGDGFMLNIGRYRIA